MPLKPIRTSKAQARSTSAEDPRRALFEHEMIEGYFDGFRIDSPEPSQNRTRSYRHGFANGRDDRAHSPRATAALLRVMAEKAIDDDIRRIYEHGKNV